MKNAKISLIVVAVLSALFAIPAVSTAKTLHPPVAIGQLNFEEVNGEMVAVSPEYPSLFEEFERPVLCEYSQYYEHKEGTVCQAPFVFMKRGGIVADFQKTWGGENESVTIYSRIDNPRLPSPNGMRHLPYYYVMETSPDIFFCVYANTEAPLCKLYPPDVDVKVGDKFIACDIRIASMASWPVDKAGNRCDCSKGIKRLGSERLGHFGRIAQLTVVDVQKGGTYLRGTMRYDINGEDVPDKNSPKLNANGRPHMMGTMSGQEWSNTLAMVKVKIPVKTATTKKKK
ncbi:MAG: hypothetical protein PHU42_01660 [Patescibacteria group bacterium]|nr:hypothetical protein [Patescibacteria group bacterium]